jgi:DNA-binding CsgD family transcriptional regulator
VALFERGDASAAIDVTLEAVANGGPRALFLVGEPGLGKTSLFVQACARAGAGGLLVGSATCWDVEASIPFGVLDRLLSQLGASVHHELHQELHAGRPLAELRARRYLETLDRLQNVGRAPLLIALDDLHWADPDSLNLFGFLVRQLNDAPVAFVATMRPWPPDALNEARRLVEKDLGRFETLEPLSAQAGARLLAERLGEPVAEDRAEAATRACAGNPFLLGEVASAWSAGDDPLGRSAAKLTERLLLSRFAGVGSTALRWARAASVLGVHFQPWLVSSLTGQDDDETAAAFEALFNAGLVRPGGAETRGGDAAEFVHPLLRQVLYDDMAAPVRQGMHAGAFHELVERGADPAEAAPHAIAAQLEGNARAVHALTAAGQAAFEVGAVATAAEHLEGALRLAGPVAPAALLAGLGQAYLLSGRVDDAVELARRALADDSGAAPDRVGSLRLLARALLAAGLHREATGCFEEASELASHYNPDLAADILLDAPFRSWPFEGVHTARRLTRQALRLLEGTENEVLRQSALGADGFLAFMLGDPVHLDTMASLVRDSLERGRNEASWSWDVVFAYTNAAKAAERFDECCLLSETLLQGAKEQGAMLTYQSLAVSRSDILWRIGRLDEAKALLVTAAELSDLSPMIAPFASIGLANTCHEMGDAQGTDFWTARVATLMATMGESAYLRLWLCLLAGRTALRRGQLELALETSEMAAGTAEMSGILEPCAVPWHGTAIEAMVAAGRLERAAQLVAQLEAVCTKLPCRAPRAVAAAGRAAIAWREGDTDRADLCYREALDHNGTVPMPLAEAETLIAYGRFLRQNGRSRRAQEVLQRAVDLTAPIGARRLEGLATEELATASGRRTSSTGKSPGARLTPQEERVANLAAAGFTNQEIATRLFLSIKTVDHHLTRIYAKLGCSRRDLMLAGDGSQSSN